MKDPEYNDEPQPSCAEASAGVYAQGPRDGGTTIPIDPDVPKPTLSTAGACAQADVVYGSTELVEGVMFPVERREESVECPNDEMVRSGPDDWDEAGPRDPGTVIP